MITLEMVKVRARVVGSGEPEDPFRVDLPTYQMVVGSEEYDKKDTTKLLSVEVLVPADECDVHGRPSKEKIREKYRSQPLWDRKDVTQDL